MTDQRRKSIGLSGMVIGITLLCILSIFNPLVNGNIVVLTPLDHFPTSLDPPSIIWNKTYGGDLLDWGWSISKTCDSGYIIGGETISFSAGGYDAFLIKTDGNGDEEWNNTFGGLAKDGCRDVKQTDDGGYILAGYADSYGYAGHDFWLIRTDENGNELWNYTYGGISSDAAVSVIQTSTGDFVMTGYSYTYSYGDKDVWVVKTNADGNEVWNHHYGGSGADQGMSIVESPDGCYVIAGFTSSFGSGGTDVWLLKIDINGNLEWDRCFGGNNDDWAGSIDLTLDGGYILSGDTKSYGTGGYDVWMIKTDNNGIEEWNQVFGDGDCHETGYCIKQTSDGGYIISGTKFIVDHDNALFIKTDTDGNEEWNLTIFTDQSDIIYSICEAENNSYVSTGYTYTYGAGDRDIWLLNIGIITNQMPDTPTIGGKIQGKAGGLYNYTFVSTDPEDQDIWYYIDWGDGDIDEWIGPFNSSEEVLRSHSWWVQGDYSIRAKAKDVCGAESDWGTLTIKMSRNKVINRPVLYFLDNHFRMFPTLRFFLKLAM